METKSYPDHGILNERDRLLPILRNIHEHTPYFKHLPFEVQDLDTGWVRLLFTIEPHFCNWRGIASGGVLAAYCDTLMGMASRTLGYQITTLEINMNYVRQVRAHEVITGVAQVVHHGRKTLVVECEFFDKDGNVVVKGRSSFYILSKAE